VRRYHAPKLLFALFLFSACSRAPHMVYRHLTNEELAEQSPIIVIGRIENQETFWNERIRQGSENGLPLFWYHVNVKVAVENVLRGDPGATPVTYTYWLPVGAKVGEWNSLRDGARYVHFLRRDDDQLRSVVDFWPSAIRVTTGRHPLLSQAEGLPQTIAQLLLSPGDDFVVDSFDISLGVKHAWGLIGHSAALSLVENLSRNSNASVRAQACEELRAAGVANSRCGE
jgi:hypothetical protein